MPGSPTTPGWPRARVGALGHIAFHYTDSVGTRNQFSIAAQWLACTFLADASPTSSRMPAHGLGSMWVATPSSQWTCTTYSSPVSRRTCAKTLAFNLRVESSSRFGQSENQKCWRRLSEEGNRENGSTVTWLAHVSHGLDPERSIVASAHHPPPVLITPSQVSFQVSFRQRARHSNRGSGERASSSLGLISAAHCLPIPHPAPLLSRRSKPWRSPRHADNPRLFLNGANSALALHGLREGDVPAVLDLRHRRLPSDRAFRLLCPQGARNAPGVRDPPPLGIGAVPEAAGQLQVFQG